MTRPPRVADALMRALLARDAYESIAGDLEESWHAGSVSRMGYWRLAIASIAAYYRERLRPQPRITVFADDIPRRKGDGFMHAIVRDIGYGLRLMRRAPAFTLAAVVTLALGIGANTAIFSLVNVLLLKPLPYRDADRVTFVLGWDTERNENRFSISLADLIEIEERTRSFERVAAYSYWSANLTGGDQPERVQAYTVTGGMFPLLGVNALIGRVLAPEDAAPGAPDVVVISHALWQRRFGGDPSAVGRQVHVDGRVQTIVGVMPREFEFPVFNFKGDLWAPRPIDRTAVLANRSTAPRATAIARLRDDISYSRAQADVDTVMRQLATEHPALNRALGARLVEMGKLDDENVGPAVPFAVATVGIVLLLACANVASLLLARGVARHRELAVRAALGAGRLRIARQLLIESLLLALGGGALGALLAFAALGALKRSLPDMVLTTQPNIQALGIDASTLLFTFAVSVASALVAGLWPAWTASRLHLQDGLKESSGAGGSAATRRLRAALVVGEVALSTLLLVSAGLLVRSYQNMANASPGFAADRVLTMTVTLPQYRYADDERRRQFFEAAVERIGGLPGVENAAFVNVLPFSTYYRGTRVVIDGRPRPEPGREPSVGYRAITPGYFDTLAIPVVAGRALAAADTAAAAPVAVVNRTFARQFFGDADPTGSRIRFAGGPADAPWRTVVGVVGDVRHSQITVQAEPELYVPFAQMPSAMMMLAARVSGTPESQVQAVRAALLAIDPQQPVYHVKPLAQMVSESMAAQTMAASVVGLFSALALLLAGVGTYGVLSYAVSQQAREFGVRMALGARPNDLLRLVMRRGLTLVSSGVVLGVVGAFAVTRLIAGALYGVGPADPLTYGVAAAVLGVVGVVACGVPAWRATRVDPLVALRMD